MIRKQKIGTCLLLVFFTFADVQAQQTASLYLKQGWGVAITAMAVIFSGLILLCLISKAVGSTTIILRLKRVMKVSGLSKEEALTMASESGAVYAAIAMAIHEITEDQHDEENTVLTIKNVARNYSPWSSKIYTLRELPRK